MHISEGVLSPPVLIAGGVLAAFGVFVGLRKLQDRQLALCAALSAVFFVGSLIHVPIGFANAHLILCGMLGVLLGWSAFPTIFIALLLQAILFQYGGLTTIGVNTFTMGTAAVISWYIYRGATLISSSQTARLTGAFLGGFFGVAFSSLLTALALSFTSDGFKAAALALIMAHIPIMFIEGIITSFTVAFIMKIKPSLLKMMPD